MVNICPRLVIVNLDTEVKFSLAQSCLSYSSCLPESLLRGCCKYLCYSDNIAHHMLVRIRYSPQVRRKSWSKQWEYQMISRWPSTDWGFGDQQSCSRPEAAIYQLYDHGQITSFLYTCFLNYEMKRLTSVQKAV